MTTLADVRAKLEAAQNCHPNAVQTLIEEALAAIDSIASQGIGPAVEWDHLRDVLPVLQAASRGEWTWHANMRCKYVELRIDMRDGGCIIRDGVRERITPAQLAVQEHDRGGMAWAAWEALAAFGSPAPKTGQQWSAGFDAWWALNRVKTHQIKSAQGFARRCYHAGVQAMQGGA